MGNTKERHNITLAKNVWRTLEILRYVQRKSISELVEDAVKNFISSKKYNPVYFKIMSSSDYCDDKENEEITKILNSLEDKDIEIAETYEI